MTERVRATITVSAGELTLDFTAKGIDAALFPPKHAVVAFGQNDNLELRGDYGVVIEVLEAALKELRKSRQKLGSES